MDNTDKNLSYFAFAVSVIGIAFAIIAAVHMFMNNTIVSAKTTIIPTWQQYRQAE